MSVNIRAWEPRDEEDCMAGFYAAYQPLIDEFSAEYQPIFRAVIKKAAERSHRGMEVLFSEKKSPKA